MQHPRCLLALVLAVCVYNLPRLIGGTVQFDSLEVHYATQLYLSDELHTGHLPFWTPYIFSGFPFLADLQVGAWYVLNWPFFLAGISPESINYELLLHTLIGCAGAYALALRLLQQRWSAVGAAMFYGLSGWFAAHSQHVGMFDAAAWLPWLILLLETVATRLTPLRLVMAALLGAAIALPGSFQIALYTFSFVAVWAALEASARGSWSTAGRFGAGLAAAAMWGGLLAAVMILPALELVGRSVRAELSARDVGLGYFHPAALLTLINPDYFGLLGHYSGPGDSTQHYFYGGILLVPMAILGARQWRVLRCAAFLGVPFIWYATGPRAGIFQLLAALPGFRSVELPMHGWFLPALGLALLGGAGLARIEARFGVRATATILAIVLIDVTAVNQLANPLAYARGSFDALYGRDLMAFQAQVAAVQPTRIWGPPLAQVAYRNHALQSRVETTYGYNPLELTAYSEYVTAAEQNPRLIAGFAASHALDAKGGLSRLDGPLPVAYFARHVVSEESPTLNELDPATFTMSDNPVPLWEFDPSSTVSVVARGQDGVNLHYSSRTPNVLRVAIPMYPGWKATMNGDNLPLLTADHAFIGVVVPAGEGDILLAYTPRFFWAGAAISALAFAALLVVLTFSKLRSASPSG